MTAERVDAERVATNGDACDPADVPQPLSTFVKGTLVLHFDGGAVVRVRLSQFDARSFLRKQQDAESSDDLTWHSLNWFSWVSERVAYSAFDADADADQNWHITPDERNRLVAAGHRRGVIEPLRAFWSGRNRSSEPTYSVRAVVALHQIALDGADRKFWNGAARTFEGSRGASLLADAPGRPATHREADDEDDTDLSDAGGPHVPPEDVQHAAPTPDEPDAASPDEREGREGPESEAEDRPSDAGRD